MSELDRILENNQTGMRMKQAQQLLKIAAEVALLAVTSGASGALSKAGAGVSKAAGAGAKVGAGLGSATGKELAKRGFSEGLKKGLNMSGKAVLEQGKNKVIREVGNKIKEQLPDGTLTALERAESLKKSADNTKNILESFKNIKAPNDANGIINAASAVLLGEKNLTHGVVGFANLGVRVVGKATTRLQAINENQKDSVELVKTFFAHDGKTALLVNKSPEEIMSKKFIVSANLTNGKAAIKIAENYSAVNSLNKLRVADLQTLIAKGEEKLGYMVGQTTADLLKDTKAILESAEEDAGGDDRSEAAIKRRLKA